MPNSHWITDSLKEIIEKALKPVQKRSIATEISGEGFSIEQACKVLNLSRSVYYYKAVKDDTAVLDKLNELSEAYPTRGFDWYNGIFVMWA